MGVLCFVADLPTLSPESLRRLKQCWLQLANYYAVAPPSSSSPQSLALGGRIALCYVSFDRIAASPHLKVAYSPGENFDLCEFHRAVRSMPANGFLPDSPTLSRCDAKLLSLISDEFIYSWSSEDIARKIVVLTSSLPPEMDATLHDSLTDAADKCVSVEFLLFETRSIHLQHMEENMSKFVRSISDLENCSVSACLPDARVLDGMTKRWLQYIRDQVEESTQARFIFNNDLVGSVNQIFCNMYISSYQIVDGLSSCQTGNWHEIIKEELLHSKIGNNLKVGEGKILLNHSSLDPMKSQLVYSTIDFKVIERTNLSSLSEGVLIGTPHVAIPSGPEIGAASSGINLELNTELFQGLCWVLQSLDQGLVCSSNYNMETVKTSIFPCYYLLQPSDYGPMLLRRLAGLEEVLPLPDINRYLNCSVSKETGGAIRASILKMELRDYNPILHDRGFHQRMNLLVEQRSEFGSLPQESKGTSSESKSSQPKMSDAAVPALEELMLAVPVVEGKPPQSQTKCTAAEEWGQLLVNEMPNVLTPTCISKLTSESTQVIDLSSADGLVHDEAKISRILERLEAPRQSNPRAASPNIAGKGHIDPSCSVLTTKNSPRLTHAARQGYIGNQLIKPSFNSKRKRQ
ncbi:uncharacterized protein LOC115755003 isoform X2 [Rhodamnia argentea]|uniref:Uncharacterized protein LOC115755003 isoform X2 n=1 Tax=Rhodamnia argentea TaxID=178133 RepID=A0A8B8QSB6_9MYRT|nr:uncharacterized protein LOC115755003 isoform X2 [Rhodamnia argentea]